MAAVDKPAFELSGGHPALDFVNTLDDRFREEGPVELLCSYRDLLRFAQQSDLLNGRQVKQLRELSKSASERALRSARELREALAEVFYSAVEGTKTPPAAIRTIENCYRMAARHQGLEWTRGRLEWTWSSSEREADMPVWMLAKAAIGLMTSDAMERLRTCDSETCRWLFLDTSKNHTRRWCNMKICGNRMKARRFQARQQE